MRVKLETVLSGVGVITAVAYVLGWLQAFYYFDTFGIHLSSVEMSPQDYLLNSWFVLENVIFFLILVWVIVNTPRWWTVAIGLAYFLIPIGAHYAFFVPHWWGANILIEYRHTLLKFIPFVLLGGVMLWDWRTGSRPVGTAVQFSWRASTGLLVLLVIVVAAWSISVAKHFGSYDANLELRYPDRMLAKVRVVIEPEAGASDGFRADTLYVVHASASQLVIWNSEGFTFGQPGQTITMYVLGRDSVKWLEIRKTYLIQRGSFIF